ncbi:hypothetical protein ACFQYP_53005 [Nonomuraea antimicrobica]
MNRPLKVDYTPISGVSKEQGVTHAKKTCDKLAPGLNIAPDLLHLDDDAQTRLLFALTLFDRNLGLLPPGFDNAQAVKRLLRWTLKSKALPGDPDQRFEREALSVSGLVKVLLLDGLRPLSSKDVLEVGKIYNPARVSTGTGTVRTVPRSRSTYCGPICSAVSSRSSTGSSTTSSRARGRSCSGCRWTRSGNWPPSCRTT